MTALLSTFAFCRTCDYPLRDLTTPRCAECGHSFDPANPATMNLGEPLGPLARFLLGRVSWPTALLILLPSACLLCAATQPVVYDRFYWYLLGAYALLMTGVIGVRRLVRIAVGAARRQPRPAGITAEWRGVGLICIIAAVLILVGLKLPLYFGLWMSKSSLDEIRGQYQPTTAGEMDLYKGGGVYVHTFPSPRRAGLYQVDEIRWWGAGIYLRISGTRTSFLWYNPKNSSKRPAPWVGGYLGGGWWWVAK